MNTSTPLLDLGQRFLQLRVPFLESFDLLPSNAHLPQQVLATAAHSAPRAPPMGCAGLDLLQRHELVLARLQRRFVRGDDLQVERNILGSLENGVYGGIRVRLVAA